MAKVKTEQYSEQMPPESPESKTVPKDIPEEDKPQETPKPLIVVAIDFGTTYSGVAHTYLVADGVQCNPDEILVLNDWPGRSSDKVPTRLAYVQSFEPAAKRIRTDSNTSSAVTLSAFKWGFDVESQDTAIECIKLLLPQNTELPKYVRRADVEAELSNHNTDVESAAVHYLQALHGEIEVDLERRYGQSRVKGTERRYVLTVPAIWADAAKNTTKQIAIRAGFPEEILLVSEPEAAAIWTIRGTSYLQPKIGDTYVVCDAGGGTVDLISYQITQLNPIRVREAVSGTGGLCGGSYINERFEQRIQDVIGVTDFQAFQKEHPENWQDAMRTFEDTIKRSFDPNRMPSRTYFIRCVGVPENFEARIHKSKISISTDEMKAIFEPIITEITNLTEHQVEAVKAEKGKPTGIFLVGGLGESVWLLERLNAHFKIQGIETMRPPSSWSSVARGAVMWAAEGGGLIQSRKSRVHYGVSSAPKFRAKEHPQDSMYWDHLDECYRANHRFYTFIEKDQTVYFGHPFSENFQRSFLEGEDRTSESWIYTSSNRDKPKSIKESHVSKLCCLRSNLNVVPTQHFIRNVNSKGAVFFTITYERKMQSESGGMKFWLEIDGIEYAAITADFV